LHFLSNSSIIFPEIGQQGDTLTFVEETENIALFSYEIGCWDDDLGKMLPKPRVGRSSRPRGTML